LRDVPPEVTTGRVVVVVGGKVVVVCRDLLVVGDVDAEGAPESDEVGVVVGGKVVVVEALGAEVVGTCAGALFEDALAPGCSFATTTPMAMVAPVDARAAARVRRRRRRLARRLVSEGSGWCVFIGRALDSRSIEEGSGRGCHAESAL
jgi:hypothetical protein